MEPVSPAGSEITVDPAVTPAGSAVTVDPVSPAGSEIKGSEVTVDLTGSEINGSEIIVEPVSPAGREITVDPQGTPGLASGHGLASVHTCLRAHLDRHTGLRAHLDLPRRAVRTAYH